MKRLAVMIAIWILTLANLANAEGIYTSTIEGKECKIEFIVGPFGPGESGYAKLYYDDVFVNEYNYRKMESDGLQVYDVLGLCKFIGNDQKLEAVQPIATFVKK